MRWSKALLAMAVIIVSVTGMVFSADVEWSYEGETGPANWGSLDESFLLCSAGQTQSPIDIVTADVASGSVPDFVLDYQPSDIVLFNNGHTIELEYTTGSFMNFDGSLYELLQFHFHAPSEHTIDGKQFAMELHLVHLCGRCFFKNEGGSITVLGLMIEEGEPSPAFNEFWLDLPRDANSEVHLDGAFNALDILPDDLNAYRYDGSLTTPPCTEGVNWLVLEEPITMSAEQILLFQSALRASCCEFNNRPVQPLNGREILVDIGRD